MRSASAAASGSSASAGHAASGIQARVSVPGSPQDVAGPERAGRRCPPNPAPSAVDAEPRTARDVDPAGQREVRPGAGSAPGRRPGNAIVDPASSRWLRPGSQPPARFPDDPAEVGAGQPDRRSASRTASVAPDERHLERRRARVVAGQEVRDREAPRIARPADRDAEVRPVGPAGVLDRREDARPRGPRASRRRDEADAVAGPEQGGGVAPQVPQSRRRSGR